jgi:thiol-disulfide isomerase/thioredoxin
MFSCKNETKVVVNNSLVTEVQDIDLEVDDFNGLQKYLNTTSDKTYVVNFWATWCSPCIKELPFFEELNKNYSSKNVEVILVSLDFPNKYETSLKPFIKEKNLQSKVVALNDTDSNTWIPKVSEDWSGAIPATLIFNKEKRLFYEQSFTYTELENEIKQFLK